VIKKILQKYENEVILGYRNQNIPLLQRLVYELNCYCHYNQKVEWDIERVKVYYNNKIHKNSILKSEIQKFIHKNYKEIESFYHRNLYKKILIEMGENVKSMYFNVCIQKVNEKFKSEKSKVVKAIEKINQQYNEENKKNSDIFLGIIDDSINKEKSKIPIINPSIKSTPVSCLQNPPTINNCIKELETSVE